RSDLVGEFSCIGTRLSRRLAPTHDARTLYAVDATRQVGGFCNGSTCAVGAAVKRICSSPHCRRDTRVLALRVRAISKHIRHSADPCAKAPDTISSWREDTSWKAMSGA